MEEAARQAQAPDLPALVHLAGAARAELESTRGGRVFFAEDPRWSEPDACLGTWIDDPDHLVVVGMIDEHIVGYGSVHLDDLHTGERLGVIDDLFVLEGARGVGVGEMMMDELVAFCRGHHCVGIDAVALPGNRATKNFFETFGLVARAIVVHRAFGATDAEEAP